MTREIVADKIVRYKPGYERGGRLYSGRIGKVRFLYSGRFPHLNLCSNVLVVDSRDLFDELFGPDFKIDKPKSRSITSYREKRKAVKRWLDRNDAIFYSRSRVGRFVNVSYRRYLIRAAVDKARSLDKSIVVWEDVA